MTGKRNPTGSDVMGLFCDFLPDGCYFKDADLRYRQVNQAMTRILGIDTPGHILGRTDTEVFDSPEAQLRESLDREILALNRPTQNHEECLPDANGNNRWYLVSRVPVPGDNHVPIGVLGLYRDITARRALEEKLARNEERFRHILEYSRDIAYLYDFSSRRYEYVSPSVTTLLGHTVDDTLGMSMETVESFVHPEDRDHIRNHRRRLLDAQRRGLPLPLCEYRLRHAKGEYRLFSEAAAFILNGGGKPKALVGNLRDITEARRMSEALRAASRMETAATLAGGVAHEFNNLLASVMTNAELLEMKTGPDAETATMVRAIIRCAEQGGELAHQLLAFARGGQYNPRPARLNDLIRASHGPLRGITPEGVRLELALADDLPLTRADAAQLQQVIHNLVVNAFEATAPGGRVTIGTGSTVISEETAAAYAGLQPGRYVLLYVEDTGHGMTEEVRERLFEPFFSTRFKGRGLGLAAVYGIVKNHGGYVFADSAPGAGTRMTVLLPESGPDTRKEPTPTQMRLPMGSETILVVDDEESVLTATRMLLERLGYKVLCAHDGREAVEILRADPGGVHLVILDMAMPVMAGPETFDHMRDIRPDLPVIIASGYDLNESIQRVLDGGAKAFLKKPVRMLQLASAIREILDN
ncbi:MAG TPA: PAS domain-containing protein [Candidatus Hydrogenedentes bacterium]|nr:PAS domain-containing protein [Candidatus Hydrogenedentota bacterium]